MIEQSAIPFLTAQLERSATPRRSPIVRRVFHTWGLPEADVDAKLKGLFSKRTPMDLGLLASPAGVLVSLTSNVLHIAGGEYPDPISKELWAEFEAWKSDAEKRGVKVAKVSRGATTSADPKEYIEQLKKALA